MISVTKLLLSLKHDKHAIIAFEKWYDTLSDDWQRLVLNNIIGLARAFLRGSELILLDEPTSNVDSINEGIILKALKEQKNKKSIILVSHRESTMAIADRIYKVKEGRMTEAV